jgi:isoamylase
MIKTPEILSGSPFPLGATWDGSGTNFAIFSKHATRVELCLFRDGPTGTEKRRIPVVAHRGPVWHCYLPGIGPGALYGYRVDGPYRPDEGHRFNPAKLVIDPYAKAIQGTVNWDAPVYGYRRGRHVSDLSSDGRDDAWGKPRSIVVDSSFDWEGDRRLQIPWSETIIYEAHLKGLTALHPDLPIKLRGTYQGASHPAIIDYLNRLGVSAVQFLPLHAFVDDDFLVRHGLRNYWGYNTLGFFAPEGRYSASGDSGGQVREFKEMVKAFHRAGIEVILDVVYNHTAEGGNLGPTLSFRGIDNAVYYRLFGPDRRFYEDVTGTGNTLNAEHPRVLKLIMDSLRYWVEEMHVDGFRFDLAPALAREANGFSAKSGFFRAVHQDPVLSSVKLIAEPWDIGPGGYRLGEFPQGWSEWNDRFRDASRRFWRGDRGLVVEFATRFAGSADLFRVPGRAPTASINFVTAHDGFTLRDLVSYERKHNLANGELNRDGSDHNNSWNNGVEGPSDDQAVQAARNRLIRNLFASLLISQGVPMILAGDEYGRSQGGNNNAYNQDNETSWLRWDHTEDECELIEFARCAIALRRRTSVFRQPEFYAEQIEASATKPVVTWFHPDGLQATIDELEQDDRQAFGLRLIPPDVPSGPDEGDEPVFIALNGASKYLEFRLPSSREAGGRRWKCVLSTADRGKPAGHSRPPGKAAVVPGRSVMVWRLSRQAPD